MTFEQDFERTSSEEEEWTITHSYIEEGEEM